MITLSFVITIDQMRAGFQRIYDMMGDISIDVPQVQFNTLSPLFGRPCNMFYFAVINIYLINILCFRLIWCSSAG